MIDNNAKVTSSHLKRDAYLYVRQSTLRQVVENQESTRRQYALREQAMTLGWPPERVQVIDSDLGHSGASAADREGFQKLVAEVGMGRAGIVLGLEVSRLARNNADWHRLLEICALSDTLILDEDGLYNPNDFNDRLLLGLKGTMSEAELHLLQARMRGGLLNKARRGAFACKLPVGFIYDQQSRVQLDPDKQVREAIHLLFSTYRRTGSASAVVKHFREQKLLFPRRLPTGLDKGALDWQPLTHASVLSLLHNPRYAGAYFYGRTRVRKLPDGTRSQIDLPRDQWHALIPNAHSSYISWSEFEENQRRLQASAQAHGVDRRQSPPREGPALLQGIALCGLCGERMTAHYHQRGARLVPVYKCQREIVRRAGPICQHITGDGVDKAVGDLLLETIRPMALEAALAVQRELAARLDEVDRLRAKQVERARYEADLARRRYMQVDPGNRLVAEALEADWNDKLRALREAQESCEQQRSADRMEVDEEMRRRVHALTTDFPRLWNDPGTADRDRKRIVRLLIEDVTLIKRGEIVVQVRFKGGTTAVLTLPPTLSVQARYRTAPEVVAQIDELLARHTDKQTADIMNARGRRTGRGRQFNPLIVGNIRKRYGLRSRYDHLRAAGMLTMAEMAARLGVCALTIQRWQAAGLLTGHRANDKNTYLYEPPGDDAPSKCQGRKLAARRRFPKVVSETIIKEQYEA